ncbi:LysR family transcriptional regulator (plasmid) [Leisingera aquaemixtae]|uniref:LysR family transcriptional regulator n=1 Tax=Leisingera aquaemixtae TaxID=1396826 RepID=UPI0039840D17
MISPTYSAKMQSHDWNDLRYLLALHRAGKLKDAGRTVGTSETTVARRVRALERELGTSLFVRSANGRYEPTDAALQILTHAEKIEQENLAIQEVSGKTTQHVAGSVRISSVPILVNRVLVSHLASLTRKHPLLTIVLVPASDNLDLFKREADLAVRFARPVGGGLRTKAQKLGEMSFAAYVASSVPPEHFGSLGWITYDEAHADMPQARWLEAAATNSDGPRACLKVADAETALESVSSGLGKSLLPRAIADADPRLQAFFPDGDAVFPVREVWLLSLVDQESRSSIIAAKEWLKGIPWD